MAREGLMDDSGYDFGESNYSVCDDCGLEDTWECMFCCDKCYEDYGECPNDDCNPMEI